MAAVLQLQTLLMLSRSIRNMILESEPSMMLMDGKRKSLSFSQNVRKGKKEAERQERKEEAERQAREKKEEADRKERLELKKMELDAEMKLLQAKLKAGIVQNEPDGSGARSSDAGAKHPKLPNFQDGRDGLDI
ncbi:hypothetical protein PoB_005202400 [Plakobranchus ocellatus]|uniref:Uncharacterized protein n=1 Tax=Plakobranchus ocellatus TaxID=259542 RepID=A0AAV4BZ67_9GAST|nr:hypothetical protein PoB_005202400 [Plakobranchus ocellatus]